MRENKRLILASSSPQRKRILRDLGILFKSVPSRIREDAGKLKRPFAIARHLAKQKAIAVSMKYPENWILGVDTLVVPARQHRACPCRYGRVGLANGKITGKPKNKAEAKAVIKSYSGSYCDIFSGIAMVNRSLGKIVTDYERARLYFKKFTNKEIDEYLSRHRWKSSSGSLTIEAIKDKWIKRLEGDYWNVVGLPIKTMKKMLDYIGLSLLQYQ